MNTLILDVFAIVFPLNILSSTPFFAFLLFLNDRVVYIILASSDLGNNIEAAGSEILIACLVGKPGP